MPGTGGAQGPWVQMGDGPEMGDALSLCSKRSKLPCVFPRGKHSKRNFTQGMLSFVIALKISRFINIIF